MISRLLLITVLCLPLFGCKASYPTGGVEDTIRELCEKEYGVAVQVTTRGRTIGALVVMEDILLSDLTFSDQALNKLEDVMLTTSRVTLSSEFDYDFFVVTILDATAGIQISFVRYVQDIKRLIMDDISRSDYFQRLLIEVELNTQTIYDPSEGYKLKEYKMSDFLAARRKTLAKEISARLLAYMQMSIIVGHIFPISGIRGEYLPNQQNPQEGKLKMTLQFYPPAPDFQSIGTAKLREDFVKLMYSTIKKIIQQYELKYAFKQFSGLTIVDEKGTELAHYDQSEFSKGGMDTLMDLIRTIKKDRGK
ncbi:hypothetical protein KAR34_04030 [bacterium]|nr:hypothetical protein [bacterium]